MYDYIDIIYTCVLLSSILTRTLKIEKMYARFFGLHVHVNEGECKYVYHTANMF